jgi:hypothetical protein
VPRQCLYEHKVDFLGGGNPKIEQVGNPTSTTSFLKRRKTKDAQGSAHFLNFKWVFKLTLKLIFKIGI